jgi:hypothetical protein
MGFEAALLFLSILRSIIPPSPVFPSLPHKRKLSYSYSAVNFKERLQDSAVP